MLKREKTKTSLFLLPILTYETGETANQILWDIGLFKNGYLKIDTHDYVSPEYTVSLHFDWKSGKHTFDRYEEILISNFKDFECIKAYAPDSTSEMMVFNIPDKHKLIYDCFLQGRYSYLPDKYKQHILKFTTQPKDGKIHRILYKSKILKEEMERELGCKIPEDVELYDPPYLDQETFTNEMKVNKNQIRLKL